MNGFYNSGFNYNNYPAYPVQQPIMPQQAPVQNQDERIWVANEQAADAYLVAPGNFVRLWDSNKNVFYEKRADASGRLTPLDTYKYEKIEQNRGLNNESATIDYKKEIEAINERILAIEKELKKNE